MGLLLTEYFLIIYDNTILCAHIHFYTYENLRMYYNSNIMFRITFTQCNTSNWNSEGHRGLKVNIGLVEMWECCTGKNLNNNEKLNKIKSSINVAYGLFTRNPGAKLERDVAMMGAPLMSVPVMSIL